MDIILDGDRVQVDYLLTGILLLMVSEAEALDKIAKVEGRILWPADFQDRVILEFDNPGMMAEWFDEFEDYRVFGISYQLELITLPVAEYPVFYHHVKANQKVSWHSDGSLYIPWSMYDAEAVLPDFKHSVSGQLPQFND